MCGDEKMRLYNPQSKPPPLIELQDYNITVKSTPGSTNPADFLQDHSEVAKRADASINLHAHLCKSGLKRLD